MKVRNTTVDSDGEGNDIVRIETTDDVVVYVTLQGTNELNSVVLIYTEPVLDVQLEYAERDN